jgi:hypothetical protein
MQSSSAALQADPLKEVGEGAAYTYSLSDLRSCRVGDATTIVSNVGNSPISITSATAKLNVGSTARISQSVLVLAVKDKSTQGSLGASFDLQGLPTGPLVPADGAVLQPAATSHLSYIFVIRLTVGGPQPAPWSVEGLHATYTVAGSGHSADFAQHVRLASVTNCG